MQRRQAARESPELERRLELIREAIRRGEEKAAVGEAEEVEPRRMTAEEEEALGKMFIQPEVMESPGAEALEGEAKEARQGALQLPIDVQDPHEVRIRGLAARKRL